ncbi:unnamed protein product [Urochloa decumbens]|uniref:Uncharacterized protein n=1 Tax=Urochloa decumbens TaxID=240449 RepID=A0ABC9BIH5_9POAL
MPFEKKTFATFTHPLWLSIRSGFTEFKLDFEATKNLSVGDFVLSDDFAAGGHIWRVICYPHGSKESNDDGVYLNLYLQLVSGSRNVKAIFDAFLMGRDGSPSPSPSHAGRLLHVYPPEGFKAWGFSKFMEQADLESDYVKDGHVTFMFGVIVLRDDDSPIAVPSPITVPSSDIGDHLGRLLDGADGSDVSFSVGGETFPAHRAVLAARSPVFKAQLLGSMADAKMPCITLNGVKPATFQILLRFIYTDALPGDEQLEESPSTTTTAIEVLKDLLAAADMYQLDRLKLVCAHRLWERVSPENVATVLGCAETHTCPELKEWCLEFFVVERNFKIAVLTEGYFRLMQSFPSVIDEIRERVQA